MKINNILRYTSITTIGSGLVYLSTKDDSLKSNLLYLTIGLAGATLLLIIIKLLGKKR